MAFCATQVQAQMQADDGYYLIGSVEDLTAFADRVNSGQQTINGRLIADIDLAGVENFTPIGLFADNGWNLPQRPYKGTFDGQGHVVKNLKVTMDNYYETGLFSRLEGAVLKNLGVINASVTNTRAIRAGVIAGELVTSKVTNCFSAGDITVTTDHPGNNRGGLSGEASNSDIKHCYSTFELLIGDPLSSAVENCYGGEEANAMAPTGQLCHQLNAGQAATVFFQTLGTDAYPVLDSTHGTVYAIGELDCAGRPVGDIAYSNSGEAGELPPHTFDEEGYCTVCGKQAGEVVPAEDGWYEIRTADELRWISRFVSGGQRNIKIRLMNDLDLSGIAKFPPIGFYSDTGAQTSFAGTFDGQYHIIYNLNITVSNTEEAGLFSRAYQAVIKNLGIVNASITNDAGVRAGVLAGEMHICTVTNCFTAGDLNVNTTHEQCSHFAGEAAGTTLNTCWTTGDNFTVGYNAANNCLWGEDCREKAASGELCYNLNGGTLDKSKCIWFQTIGEDEFPIFDSTHGFVYKVEDGLFASAVTEDEFLELAATVVQGELDKWEEAVASQRLRESYMAKLEEMKEMDYEAFLEAYNAAAGIRDALISSYNAYTAYQTKAGEVGEYIDAHDAEFAGPDRDLLEDYLNTEIAPGDVYAHGSYPYIIENPTLTTIEVLKETAALEQMLNDAVSKGYLIGANVTGMLQNADFTQGNTGWDINEGSYPTSIVKVDEGLTMGLIQAQKANLSQTLTGLKDGIYLFRMNSYLEVQKSTMESQYNYIGYVYANGMTNYVHTKFTSLFQPEEIETGWADQKWFSEENGAFDENGTQLWGCSDLKGVSIAFGMGHYDNCILANVTDGELTVGIQNKGAFSRQFDTFLGNARLYYCGTMDEATEALDEVLGDMTATAAHICNDYIPSVTYTEAPSFHSELKAELAQAIAEAKSASDNATKYALIGKISDLFNKIFDCKAAYLEMMQTLEEAQAALYDQSDDPALLEQFETLYAEYEGHYANEDLTQTQAEERVENLKSTVYYKLAYGEEAEEVDGVYQLGTPYNLIWFSKKVNSGQNTIKGALTADIDMAEIKNFTPIGTYSDNGGPVIQFKGTFDGQGHIVKNLTIHVTDKTEAGFFSRTFQAVIKNLGIVNATVTNFSEDGITVRAGVMGGECHASNVYNCFTAGNLVVETDHDQAGGLFGEAASTNLYNCYTTASTLASSGATTNCFVNAAAEAPTGALAFRINETLEEPVYFQNLPGDEYPVLDPTHGVVYAGGRINCAGEMTEVTFSNDPNATYERDSHEFGDDDLCIHCGETIDACEVDKEGYYLIATGKNLAWFSNHVNKGNEGAKARMTADVDMTGIDFTPIGLWCNTPDEEKTGNEAPNRRFSGVFDGQGHVIRNLNITVPAYGDAGLVSFLFGGSILNVGIENASVTSPNVASSSIGVLCGRSINTTVRNCYVIGDIQLTTRTGDIGAAFSGALIACLQTGDMYNCFTTYHAMGSSNGSNCYSSVNVNDWGPTGELCYKLNSGNTKNPVWFQNIGTDAYPVLDNTHSIVYMTSEADYTNAQPDLMKYAGTKDDPFIINTVQELQDVASYLVADSLNYIRLAADLDMSEVTKWTPLNLSTKWIDFDGQGHVIKNFNVTTTDTKYMSIFGILAGGLRNLGLENASVVTSASGDGLLAGYVGHTGYGKPTYIEHVYVTGQLEVTNNYAGGMFGTVGDTVVMKNCYANVDINSTDAYTGGIIARVHGALTMENCYAAGSFTRGGGVIGGGQESGTPSSTYKNVVVWNNDYENFGNLRLQDDLSGISYYYGNNFAELQKTVVAWDSSVWSCDMQDGSYPILVGTAVGIKDIMAEGEGRKGIYDLSGRRLSDSSKLAKGIYIINGKKVAVGK